MSYEHRPLDEFEAQLAALRPAASGVDRDALLYEAGRAAGSAAPRRAKTVARWLSPLLTAASLALAAPAPASPPAFADRFGVVRGQASLPAPRATFLLKPPIALHG